jgi:pyruvate/2-oxoglutarate dehydrogenase complex dihydrolipoamide acyltransferase (E2) component
MPQLGESVAEGTIGRWLKQVGDHVTKYEPIVEVITDKVNAEVPSPFEGTLSEILVDEGATVPNGAEIAVIEEAGPATAAVPVPASAREASADVEQPGGIRPAGSDEERPTGPANRRAAEVPAPPAPAAARAPEPATLAAPTPTPVAAALAPAAPPAVSGAATAAPAAEAQEEYRGPVTPAVRRLARENDVDLGQVQGTGHGGRVTRDDIMAFVDARSAGAATQPAVAAPSSAAQAPSADRSGPVSSSAPVPPAASAPAPPAPPAVLGDGDQLKPLTQMRKGIAAQMTRAAGVPMAYLTLEVDMSGVVGLRERIKDEYQAREGVGLSYVAIVTKAVVEALRRHPDLNAHWTDQGLLRRSHVNVGIAVAVDDGLIVPVIHDSDRLSINGLNRGVVDLAGRARSNRLRIDELQGGTFTVDNTGWFGSIVSAPIVNVPEVAILTMEAIQRRPVVVGTPGGEAIAIRPMMYICSAFDHRATDGAQMGRFMQDVKQWLESVDEGTAIW